MRVLAHQLGLNDGHHLGPSLEFVQVRHDVHHRLCHGRGHGARRIYGFVRHIGSS
ncbi:MAG: hypothetical protein MJY87_02505 [Fibrobacter sp.]|nr:hypothetical protein [Fibrobacter sp.]